MSYTKLNVKRIPLNENGLWSQIEEQKEKKTEEFVDGERKVNKENVSLCR